MVVMGPWLKNGRFVVCDDFPLLEGTVENGRWVVDEPMGTGVQVGISLVEISSVQEKLLRQCLLGIDLMQVKK